MGDPGTITLVKNGRAISVPTTDAASLLASGYTEESAPEQQQREESQLYQERDPGTAAAVIMGGLRGATLGGSDALVRAEGGADQLEDIKQRHPTASYVGELVGSLSPVGPAARLNKIGERVIEMGEGAGVLGKAAYSAGGSALIGAGQGAGDYISQVALEDKPLSAEAFVGALGKGGLFGAGVGTAFSLSSEALLRAKALFPLSEVSAAAAQKIDREASSQVQQALGDSDTMIQTSRQKLEEMRLQKAQVDLSERQQLADARVGKAQAQLEAEQARTERAKALAERAKNPPARKPRKAFEEPTTGEPATTLPETAGSTGETQVSQTSSAQPQAPSTLLEQLQGTKAALDAGAELGDVSRMATPAEQKLAEATQDLARAKTAVEAWTEKYGKNNVDRFERSQAARDYAENMRPKEAGYYDKVPEGEGNAALPRGRQSVFRGSEAERAAIDEATIAKVQPEDRLGADGAIDRMFGKPRNLADEILSGGPPKPTAPDVEATIRDGLKAHNGEHVDLAPQVESAAKVIGDFEQAHANMVDALKQTGADIPTTAAEQATQYQEAVKAHADKTAASTAQAAQDLDTKLQPALAKEGGGDLAKGAKGLMAKAGDTIGVLEMLGAHVPLLHAIPVIGPLLSTVLKAKAVMGIIGRKGGSVARSSEAVIASKAAATRNRINSAVRSSLTMASKATASAAPKAAAVAGVLSSPLMPRDKRTKAADDPMVAYRGVLDDLAKASQPGAVRNAVTSVVKTSDPDLLNSIVDVHQRMLSFLDSKAPKPASMPGLLDSADDWRLSRVKLEKFARYKSACEDPAAVLESVAKGEPVNIEAAETLRVVYPSLYREAQMTLLKEAATLDKDVPYARRRALSVLFQVPVDRSMSAEHIQFLQAGVQPVSQPAQGSPAPHPALAAPVNVGTRAMTAMDRRAGA